MQVYCTLCFFESRSPKLGECKLLHALLRVKMDYGANVQSTTTKLESAAFVAKGMRERDGL